MTARKITQGDRRSLRRIIRKHIVRSDRDFGMLRTEYIERVEVDDMAADLVEWADRRALRTASAPAPLLTAAPNVTREDVARTIDEGAFDFPEECAGDIETALQTAHALLVRFNITPKEDR